MFSLLYIYFLGYVVISASPGFLGVSAEYLITGNVDGKFAEIVEEQELLDYYRRLTPEKQEAILKNIRWLAE